jgi:hypothetical protein
LEIHEQHANRDVYLVEDKHGQLIEAPYVGRESASANEIAVKC